MKIDNIIIGAGFAGIVVSERLARINNAHVLLIEQRNHIGGNCYDCYDNKGILIQPYGPHIFHTDNQKVWLYLSQFTAWHYYQHKVLGVIDGQIVPIPFNLNTLYALFHHNLASRIEDKLISTFGFGKRLSVSELFRSKDADLQFLGTTVREKIFLNYTIKQWGIKPEEITEIFNRVPVVISKDDRYFHHRYQGVPKYGFTKMFEKMLDHPNIKILLNTPMKELIDIYPEKNEIRFMGNRFEGNLIYTGMIDELFDLKYGELPYRAIKFDHEGEDKEFFQKGAVINYPNDYDFTRITEFKYLTGQTHHCTSILREYPCHYSKDGSDVPCYPIITSENQVKLKKYMKLIAKFKNIFPIGRLAEYKYYDMDDMVARALDVFEKKLKNFKSSK
jgi:UDP-galactopyranose mutase